MILIFGGHEKCKHYKLNNKSLPCCTNTKIGLEDVTQLPWICFRYEYNISSEQRQLNLRKIGLYVAIAALLLSSYSAFFKQFVQPDDFNSQIKQDISNLNNRLSKLEKVISEKAGNK